MCIDACTDMRIDVRMARAECRRVMAGRYIGIADGLSSAWVQTYPVLRMTASARAFSSHAY